MTETINTPVEAGENKQVNESGKRPLIFAGTTEGRQMSVRLSAAGIEHIVCVATAYGELVMEPGSFADIRQGRLSEPEMEALISTEASVVFDATHPYAQEVTKNIREASFRTGTAYVRIIRRESAAGDPAGISTFADAASCADALTGTEGNILLTTGSKDLHFYAKDEEVRTRLYARVLPSVESITLCEAFGLHGRQVIAMQGPFSYETDLAMIRQYDIRTLVTKSSGSAGGYDEKMQAAAEAGIDVFVIGRPAEENGLSVSEALHAYFGLEPVIRVDLVGTGPGRQSLMTDEAREAIRSAEIIFGAPRMIEPYKDKHACPYYLAKDIIPVIEKERPERIAVLFSGDTGFYSGAASMAPELDSWLSDKGYESQIVIHPGISSFSYLSAAAGISYSDAGFCSIHGRADDENTDAVIRTVRRKENTFLLLSGAADVRKLGGLLIENGLEECTVVLGNRLSYDDEILAALTPEKCKAVVREGLYTALIVNKNALADDAAARESHASGAAASAAASAANTEPPAERQTLQGTGSDESIARRLMPVIDDESFIRGRVPMSKDNIRHLSIMKLDLRSDSVVYDIGSGTGSVACEMAGLSESLRVYAIEIKEDACNLIKQNADHFGLRNIGIVYGKAPEAFAGLEAPTHAFIGGSSGNLRSIIEALVDKLRSSGSENGIRIVVNAVSLETISELSSLASVEGVSDVSIEQVSVSRSRKLGKHQLMTAENPVMIAAFTLGAGK